MTAWLALCRAAQGRAAPGALKFAASLQQLLAKDNALHRFRVEPKQELLVSAAVTAAPFSVERSTGVLEIFSCATRVIKQPEGESFWGRSFVIPSSLAARDCIIPK